MTKDGKMIYVVDQINFCVNIIDVEKKKLIERVAVGRYPFGVALSPDEQRLYVANVGVFEYNPIGDIDKDNLNKSGLDYPAFSYNSEESKTGIEREGKYVPPLGDPNAPESFSVWTIELKDKPKVVAKIKTGFLVGTLIEGIPAVGGSSPNSIVATDDFVFVSNGNNDCISVIDAKSDSLLSNFKISLDDRLRGFRGIIPFGIAISPDKKRLYIAESGINAVGIIDIPSMSIVGHIPVGWFPAKLKVSNDGKKLIVTNAKGWGSGPNGGKDYQLGPEGSYIGSLMKGSVSIIDIPDDNTIKNTTTKQVIENNFKIRKIDKQELNARMNSPIPIINTPSNTPIKHIVFISKENRTYDEVFGQIRNGEGDPTLARYGLKASFTNRDGTLKVDSADVMKNHIALAKRFSIGDNFYVDADHSADGHRWLAGMYPNEWVETIEAAAYGG
jgi:YVTN family beta-propeller protein